MLTGLFWTTTTKQSHWNSLVRQLNCKEFHHKTINLQTITKAQKWRCISAIGANRNANVKWYKANLIWKPATYTDRTEYDATTTIYLVVFFVERNYLDIRRKVRFFEKGNSGDDDDDEGGGGGVVAKPNKLDIQNPSNFPRSTLIYICQRPARSYKCLHKTVVNFPTA